MPYRCLRRCKGPVALKFQELGYKVHGPIGADSVFFQAKEEAALVAAGYSPNYRRANQ